MHVSHPNRLVIQAQQLETNTDTTSTTTPKHETPTQTSGKMCWIEKQYSNCPLCGGVGAPADLYLGCPFGSSQGDCNFTFETSANVIRSHRACIEIDRIAREARSGLPPSVRPPIDSRPPSPPTPLDTPLLPANWDAGNTNELSHAMSTITHRRDEYVNMVRDFIPTVTAMTNEIAPLSPHFAVVITWVTNHMAGGVLAANTYVQSIQTAEFDIANNLNMAANPQWRIDNWLAAIQNSEYGSESAFVWHRRYTDLFVHLRRLAGQLSPPRAVADEVPPPVMARRGAIACLEVPEDTEDDESSDPMPQPTFYLPADAFDDDAEDYDPEQDEPMDEYDGDDDMDDGNWP
jgi:hypothetical protein